MKAFIAEVNVTSPERIMCGHFLLCYCCLLLSQQSRCQIHLICRYCLESHHFLQLQELLAVRKLKRRLAAQLAASGAVDVVEQKNDIFLRVGAEALPARENIADILVVLLYMRFLPVGLWGTVVNPCPSLAVHSEFHFSGVLELSAVVSQDYRKQLPEGVQAQCRCQPVKLFHYGFCFTIPH